MDPEKAVPFYDYFLARSPPANRNIFGRRKDEVQLVVHRGAWWLWKRKNVP
jgi:hypothetical protein